MKIRNILLVSFALLVLFSGINAFEISNGSITQKFKGATYAENVNETLQMTAPYGKITYTAQFAHGLPVANGANSTNNFQPTSTDNINVTLFNSQYNLLSAGKSNEKSYIKLTYAAGLATYGVGTKITNLKGAGSYAKKNIAIKVIEVNQTGESSYSAKFGMEVNGTNAATITTSSKTFLENSFYSSSGNKILASPIYVNDIGIDSTSGKGFVKVFTGDSLLVLIDKSTLSLGCNDCTPWKVSLAPITDATNPTVQVIKSITLTK